MSRITGTPRMCQALYSAVRLGFAIRSDCETPLTAIKAIIDSAFESARSLLWRLRRSLRCRCGRKNRRRQKASDSQAPQCARHTVLPDTLPDFERCIPRGFDYLG